MKFSLINKFWNFIQLSERESDSVWLLMQNENENENIIMIIFEKDVDTMWIFQNSKRCCEIFLCLALKWREFKIQKKLVAIIFSFSLFLIFSKQPYETGQRQRSNNAQIWECANKQLIQKWHVQKVSNL